MSIGRLFYARPGIFGAFQDAIASRLAPTRFGGAHLFFDHLIPQASLLAKNDDAVCRQNSSVLDSEICRDSPIDTKNRLAAEV